MATDEDFDFDELAAAASAPAIPTARVILEITEPNGETRRYGELRALPTAFPEGFTDAESVAQFAAGHLAAAVFFAFMRHYFPDWEPPKGGAE